MPAGAPISFGRVFMVIFLAFLLGDELFDGGTSVADVLAGSKPFRALGIGAPFPEGADRNLEDFGDFVESEDFVCIRSAGGVTHCGLLSLQRATS